MPGSLKWPACGPGRELDRLQAIQDEERALVLEQLGEPLAAGPGIERRIGDAEPFAEGVFEERFGRGLPGPPPRPGE